MKNRPRSYISLPSIYSNDPLISTPNIKHPRRKSFQQDDDYFSNQKKSNDYYCPPPLPISPSFYNKYYDPSNIKKEQGQQDFMMDYFYSNELPSIRRGKKVSLELKSTTIMTGQWIEGNIILDFDLNDIIHLELSLQGIESVMDESYNYSIKTHTYSFLKTTILSLNGFQVDRFNSHAVQKKNWKIPFRYQLPTHFHHSSSYEDKQCAIEYAMQCEITARSMNPKAHVYQKTRVDDLEEKEFYQTQKNLKLYHHVLPEDLNEFDQPIKERKKIWENISPSSTTSSSLSSLSSTSYSTMIERKSSMMSLSTSSSSSSSPCADLTINMNRSFWIAGSSLYVTMQIKNHSMNTIQDIRLDLIKRQNTYLSSPLTSGFDLMPISSISETILSTPASSFDWWYIIEPNQHDHVILSLVLPENEFTIKHQKLIDISYALRISVCSSSSTESVTELPIYIIQPHTIEPLQNEKDDFPTCKEEGYHKQGLVSNKHINEKDTSYDSISSSSTASTSSHYSAFLPITTSITSISNNKKQQETQQQLEKLQREQMEKNNQLQRQQKQLEELQKKEKEKRDKLNKQKQEQEQQLLLQQHQQRLEKKKVQEYSHQQQNDDIKCSTSAEDNTKDQRIKRWNKKNIYQWVKKKSYQYFDKSQQQQNIVMSTEEKEIEDILKSPLPTTNMDHHYILSPVVPTSSFSTPSPSKTARRVIHYYDNDNELISSPPSSIQEPQPSLTSSSGFSSSDSSFSTTTSSFSKKIKTPLLASKRPFIKKCKSFVSTPTSKHASLIKNNHPKEDSLYFFNHQQVDGDNGFISPYSQKLEIPSSHHPSLFATPQTNIVHPFKPKKKRPTSFYGTSMLNYLAK
ncbi:unnamed protein product [Cunninghamella blakesleeana]